jgi:hypothetical protein
MSVPREGDWFDVAPFTQEVSPFNPERAHFVDVGGSIGHQCARLKAKYPNLPGRIILQDLPETIKAARPIEGVEFMAHDFFKPQPVKGMFGLHLQKQLANLKKMQGTITSARCSTTGTMRSRWKSSRISFQPWVPTPRF